MNDRKGKREEERKLKKKKRKTYLPIYLFTLLFGIHCNILFCFNKVEKQKKVLNDPASFC